MRGFKKIYSNIVKDHFLNAWMSEDGMYVISKALRGEGYYIHKLDESVDSVHVKTPEEGVEFYEKYLKL